MNIYTNVPTKNKSKRPGLYISLVLALTLFAETPFAQTKDYLDAGEIGGITVATGALYALGLRYVNRKSTSKPPRWDNPPGIDQKLLRFLGGKCTSVKTNFLDNNTGSAATPIFGAVGLIYTNLAWPEDKDGKDAVQDLFLFTAGVVATKGITDIVKGLSRRERPLPCLEAEIAQLRTDIDLGYDHQSFFSGHTSSAFFSMTYLNKRIRSTMRREMSVDEYRRYRWVSPAILYSWSAVVGWSRIQAYKHFPSDVAVGAIAGYLLGELFFSFNSAVNNSPGETFPNASPVPYREPRPTLLSVTISF
ncbi:MAG: phosphatase PAP2 family protein [candidate division Zixibacteria bacterium]|nr:phosphatase PAP2 family protein [candidate division Zixibacteria bacterium]